MEQLSRIAAWVSQGINCVFLFGHHDQTVSARAYCARHTVLGQIAYRLINAVFFWQHDHCRKSHLRDREWAEDVLANPCTKPPAETLHG